ncbi:hypothetical protein AMIS_53360 [Actinoplanes missouriensis 431]|uniref:Uncharacterized protein n=1 Tax=Actinoplanes missouriensis (strain ATCC 14538 / DSM 43046 / CBS 188.64 / JCM 3121 / NBRC 102363 / NCIMB 12654 / NRRL B-3342 / UNCC 431) TaxID=512565 RepID=I0HC19_ACTM4|nr:hypothetical protein AMIS_53360 [Actinoplanes missouriensis 431]
MTRTAARSVGTATPAATETPGPAAGPRSIVTGGTVIVRLSVARTATCRPGPPSSRTEISARWVATWCTTASYPSTNRRVPADSGGVSTACATTSRYAPDCSVSTASRVTRHGSPAAVAGRRCAARYPRTSGPLASISSSAGSRRSARTSPGRTSRTTVESGIGWA